MCFIATSKQKKEPTYNLDNTHCRCLSKLNKYLYSVIKGKIFHQIDLHSVVVCERATLVTTGNSVLLYIFVDVFHAALSLLRLSNSCQWGSATILYVWHSFLMGLDKIWLAPSVPTFINVIFCQLGKTLVLGLAGPAVLLGFITSAGQWASQLSLKRR